MFLAPALFLLIAGWCALILLTGHTKLAQVLSCGAHAHVAWIQNGKPRYAGVDLVPGRHPGSLIQIEETNLFPGGVVTTDSTHAVAIIMTVLAGASLGCLAWLIPLIRRQRAKAWTAWDSSRAAGSP